MFEDTRGVFFFRHPLLRRWLHRPDEIALARDSRYMKEGRKETARQTNVVDLRLEEEEEEGQQEARRRRRDGDDATSLPIGPAFEHRSRIDHKHLPSIGFERSIE